MHGSHSIKMTHISIKMTLKYQFYLNSIKKAHIRRLKEGKHNTFWLFAQ